VPRTINWCGAGHRPGSLSLKSQANPPGMAKGATGWSFWLLLCSGFHLLMWVLCAGFALWLNEEWEENTSWNLLFEEAPAKAMPFNRR